MTAKAYHFGHPIIFLNGKWVYEDNQEPIRNKRKCPLCKKHQTKEGHDPCIANTSGVIAACCGHGVEKMYFMLEENQILKETLYFYGTIGGEE